MGILITAFIDLILSTFTRLAADEIKDWSPAAAEKIKTYAVGRLPEEQRERYSEEWSGHIDAIPGKVSKVVFALGLIVAAEKICSLTQPRRFPAFHIFTKRAMDILLSSVGLTLMSPLMLLIAISIRLTCRGPIFDRFQLAGRGGKPILVLTFKTRSIDRQITPVGEFLQKYSFDQLPLFFSVLSGDMSFVGPRPSLQGEAPLSILPGLVSPNQVSRGPATLTQDDYIARYNLFLDLSILFRLMVKFLFRS